MPDETTQTADAAGRIIAFDQIATIRPLFTLNPDPGNPDAEPEVYEFRLLEFDFSIQEHAEHQADSAEFDELWAKPGRLVCKDTGVVAVDGECPEHENAKCLRRDVFTAADGKRLKTLLDRMFCRCLVKGDELKDKLTDEQKREVIGTFPYAPRLAALAAQQETDQTEMEEQSPVTTGT